jgi:hypothetical protein
MRRLWTNIGFVCVALVLVYCVVHAFDPPRLNWGDSGSDYNVMTSGLNFQKYGFLKLRLTPYLMDPAFMQADDRIFVYTHYPQLPDLMNGVYRTVFHLSDLVQFRFIALGFSFGALFFIYSLLCTFWTRTTAQVALALWVTNPLWIQHADYLHHSPYGSFFGAGSLYFLDKYLRNARRTQLVASGVCLFFVYLASYDYWFFAPLLLAMVTVAHHRTLVSRRVIGTLGALALFAVAAVAFKVGTNIWVLGGVHQFVNDLRFQFLERGTDAVTRSSYRTGVWPTMYGRVERFFSLLMFPITAFWIVAPLLSRRYGERWPALRSVRANPVLLLLAALPFLYLFQEIWVGQYYPALLVLPFYAVASAAVISLFMQSAERSVRLIGVALVVALLANSLDEDLRFKKAFFERETIRTLKAQLDTVSVPGQMLMINHVFDAPYRYYFNRQTVAMILDPPGVVELALSSFANPATHPKSGKADGAIFVQHKHLTDQLFDKGYYYILGRYHLWSMWGNPPKYRAAIDALIAERDSVLMSKVARMGTKLYETDAYVVWRVRPSLTAFVREPTPSRQN